jgi:hypothetical protein
MAPIHPYRSNKDLGHHRLLFHRPGDDAGDLGEDRPGDWCILITRTVPRTSPSAHHHQHDQLDGEEDRCNLNNEEKKVLREVLDDLQGTYVEKAKLNKGNAPEPAAPSRTPPADPRPPKPNVKEWISMVQQEIAKKKQNPK